MKLPIGLERASFLRKRPECIPAGKLTGLQRQGLRYQELFTRYVDRKILSCRSGLLDWARIRPNQWVRYEDELGTGYAEIDLLLIGRGFNLIFELKRTFALYGLVQLGQLYAPLVDAISPDTPCFKLLVCKNLTAQVNKKFLVESLDDWLFMVEDCLDTNQDIPILTLQWRP
jgi:hypothetical protein